MCIAQINWLLVIVQVYYIGTAMVTFIVTLPVSDYPGRLAQCKLCPGYILFSAFYLSIEEYKFVPYLHNILKKYIHFQTLKSFLP